MRESELFPDRIETSVTIKGKEVKFSFVPESFNIELMDKFQSSVNQDKVNAAAELLVSSDLKWDLLDDDGNPLPTDLETLRRRRFYILMPIVGVVSDYAAPKA